MANTEWMLNAFGKTIAKSLPPDCKKVKIRDSSKNESPQASELEHQHPQFQPSLEQLKLMLNSDISKKSIPKG